METTWKLWLSQHTSRLQWQLDAELGPAQLRKLVFDASLSLLWPNLEVTPFFGILCCVIGQRCLENDAAEDGGNGPVGP